MTRSQATPASSQALWLEQRVEKLEDLAEERLQNCAALISENERLRSELARPESTEMTLMRTLVQSQATELERLRKDADRYQFIRDADRSDCVWREICIYAMETLDEYIDAAMDGEKAMKGTP